MLILDKTDVLPVFFGKIKCCTGNPWCVYNKPLGMAGAQQNIEIWDRL